jgi:hypothetical protein
MSYLFWAIYVLLTHLNQMGILDRLIDYWHLPGWMKYPAEMLLILAIAAAIWFPVVFLFQFLFWVFSEWRYDDAKVPAAASLVLAIVSLLVYPLFLSPLAMICGAFAGSKDSRVGWFGFGVALVSLVGWGVLLILHRPTS